MDVGAVGAEGKGLMAGYFDGTMWVSHDPVVPTEQLALSLWDRLVTYIKITPAFLGNFAMAEAQSATQAAKDAANKAASGLRNTLILTVVVLVLGLVVLRKLKVL